MDLHKSPSLRWLYLGIGALTLSGLYSIILVLLRTPFLSSLLNNSDLFKTTLVIHVNLSVFVWLLSSMAYLWSINLDEKFDYWINYLSYLGLIGILFMSTAPLMTDSNPVLNNYIPMLENWCFVSGLVLFACACIGVAIINIYNNIQYIIQIIDFKSASKISSNAIIRLAITNSALMTVVTYVLFILSYLDLQKVPYPLDLHFYYETVFWSFGHILQFVYVQGIMIVWVILSNITLTQTNISKFIFTLNLLLILPSIYVYIFFTCDSVEFIEFFTSHMRYCGSLAPILIVIAMIYNYSSYKYNNACAASLLLFFLGGVLGLLISGINVTIPAHYHGSIVGISIGFMGLSYKALQINSKASKYQPWFYAAGQTIHIIGLAWSGGYGVLRKTPAAELTSAAKISMGFMGFGGLVAIIGGLMFVWICTRRILYKKI